MRLDQLTKAQLTAEQDALYNALIGGLLGGTRSAAVITDDQGHVQGPFTVMLHHPTVGHPVQDLGAVLRFRGSLSDPFNFVEGREKLRDTWAAGVRLGYLVAPNVYSYVNAGYTGSEWSGASLSSLAGGPIVATTPSFHRDGWFIGGGVENNLNIFGITAPGWFMKTEYRSAFFDRITLPETFVGGGLTGSAVTFKPWVQTISTSLVYRFNWGGARY